MPEGISELIPSAKRKGRDRERELTGEEREIRGVWESIQYVDKVAKSKKTPIDEDVVRQIHSRVMGHYHPEIAGKYREDDPEIQGSVMQPVHHTLVRGEMLTFGRELGKKTAGLDQSLGGIERVLDVAAWAHHKLVRIHPFDDGNGRTARQIVDLMLKRGGLYYITDWGGRDKYLDALGLVDKTGDSSHFKRFLAGRLAARYDQVSSDLIKSRSSQAEKASPVLTDLLNRRQWLARISSDSSS